jgi:tRNA (mo5U34)-methyltransferase
MIDYQPLYEALLSVNAERWAKLLLPQLETTLHTTKNNQLWAWQKLINDLPDFNTSNRFLDQSVIQIGRASEISKPDRSTLEYTLKSLMPWRKGPFEFFGISVDAEWRSDYKWQRLQQHISPLKHRLILDVGCNNGYFCWRMLGNQAKLVIGVDPLLLNIMQFELIRKLHGNNPPVFALPLGIEDLPNNLKLFDTVFSMGVLYHRRSPIDHLLDLKGCLTPGGELILETLVIDGELGHTLLPEERYANMRNVWFIPSCSTLTAWLKRCGFINIRLVDVSLTTTDEQRRTEWMTFQSLENFLSPNNPMLTCEGLPAPKRAIFIAENAQNL